MHQYSVILFLIPSEKCWNDCKICTMTCSLGRVAASLQQSAVLMTQVLTRSHAQAWASLSIKYRLKKYFKSRNKASSTAKILIRSSQSHVCSLFKFIFIYLFVSKPIVQTVPIQRQRDKVVSIDEKRNHWGLTLENDNKTYPIMCIKWMNLKLETNLSGSIFNFHSPYCQEKRFLSFLFDPAWVQKGDLSRFDQPCAAHG